LNELGLQAALDQEFIELLQPPFQGEVIDITDKSKAPRRTAKAS
jgi:hypothetical protein